jgi:hypothetical protein
MSWLDSLAGKHHSIIRRRPYGCLTGGDGNPFAADLEMEHRYEPEE